MVEQNQKAVFLQSLSKVNLICAKKKIENGGEELSLLTFLNKNSDALIIQITDIKHNFWL